MPGFLTTNRGAIVVLKHRADVIKAKNANGLQLQDDGGNLGVFVEDGGQVGVGIASPDSMLHVLQGSAGTVAAYGGTTLTLEHSGSHYINFLSPAGNYYQGFLFGDADDNDQGQFLFYHADNSLVYYLASSLYLRIDNLGAFFINESSNANMTVGLTINQGAADNHILELKSSDVAHGMTSFVETDSFLRFKKIVAASGGADIAGWSSGSLGVLISGFITSVNTTKSTAGTAAVMIDGGLKSGTALAAISADGNILAVRNFGSAVWIVDEDGDTWQSGTITTGGDIYVPALGAVFLDGVGGHTYIYEAANDQMQFFVGANRMLNITSSYLRAYYNVYINETANTGMSLGLTINQGANTNEILAFKSSDIAHGCTTVAETDTYCCFQRGVALSGGTAMLNLTETDIAFRTKNYCTTENTTKGSTGYGYITHYFYKISGTGTTDVGANANLFCLRPAKSSTLETVFIVDEDGDTWQSGRAGVGVEATVGGLDVLYSGSVVATFVRTGAACSIYVGADNSTACAVMGWTHSGTYARYGHISNVYAITIDSGSTVYMGTDTSPTNANMTLGLTINQGANDDEILAFKSSDVDHGYTSVAETDTYATFEKAAAAYGGLQIRGFMEDAVTYPSIFIQGYGGTANTTKSAAGRALIEFYAAELSGGAIANVTADGNVLAVRARVGGSNNTLFMVDEDGDTWQSGEGTFRSSSDVGHTLNLGTGVSNWTTAGWNKGISMGVASAIRWSVSGGHSFGLAQSGAALYFIKSTVNDVSAPATYPLYFAASYCNFSDPGLVYVNETSNANMTIGLTINQGANDDEILAFKSSDVAHGLTAVTETDTYTLFKKYSATLGGLKLMGVTESNVGLALIGHTTAAGSTNKTSAATGAVTIHGYLNNGVMGANANILAVMNGASTCVFLVDEDGDTWQSGTVIAEGTGTHIFGTNTGSLCSVLVYKDVGDETARGLTIDYNGAGTLTATRTHQALHIDADNAIDENGFYCNIYAAGMYNHTSVTANALYGIYNQMGPTSTADVSNVFGYYLHLHHAGSGTVTTVRGVYVYVDEADVGTVTTVRGLDVEVGTFSGAASAVYSDDALDYGLNMVNTLENRVGGKFLIGETSNANMTVGLTINQGAADDEILAFKSSDVAHGCTTYAETDTYAHFLKLGGSTGGLMIEGFTEAAIGMCLVAYATSDDTAKTTAGAGAFYFDAFKISGAGRGAQGANANVAAFATNNTTVLILDEDGDLYIGGAIGELANGNQCIVLDSSGAVTKPLQPAFSVTMTANQTNIVAGGARTIQFDSEVFDQNSDFNTGTYTFTAPVTGKYHLSAMLRCDQIDTAATYYYISIVTSNRTYTKYLDPNFSADLDYYNMSLSVIADMDASDTAYVAIFQSGGANQTDIIATSSFFMGYLLG